MPGRRVSSADFVRNFAEIRDSTARGPVIVKNHGRDTHVLLSMDQYEALLAKPEDTVGGGDPLTELGNWLTDAIVQCDRDTTIRHVNRVAEALFRRSSSELVGQSLESLPELATSHLLALVARVNATNEPETVEVASPFGQGGWMRFRCLPWRDSNVLIFRDLSEAATAQRLAETKNAIVSAMNRHGGIGYVRTSVRGVIDRTDIPFSTMLGLPEDRLIGTPLVNLVAREDRMAVRDALEDTLDRGTEHRLDIDLMSNGGETVPATLALAQISGLRGVSGAAGIVTVRQPT